MVLVGVLIVVTALEEVEELEQSELGRQVNLPTVRSNGPIQQTYPSSHTLDPRTQSFQALTVGPDGIAEVVVGNTEQSLDGRQVNLPKERSSGPTQQTNPSSHELTPTVQSL